MLLAVDLHKDFIDIEGVAITSVPLFQLSGVYCAKLDAPQTYRLAADRDTTLGQEIFDVAVTQIEPEVEPDGIGNHVGWGAPSRNRWRL